MSSIMIKFFVLLSLLCSAGFSYATDDEVLNYMAEKMVKDFHNGIKLYNEEKDSSLPLIEEKDGAYAFSINKNNVRFTLINYLNDQIFINDKMTSVANIMAPKTSYLDLIIKPAYADDDMPTLDGESTKILLHTLSTFGVKLEKVGWTCISDSCKKEVRDRNLEKISFELKKRKDDCKDQQYETSESIQRYKRHPNIIHALSFLPASEFSNVKAFMLKVTQTNQKAVADFMEDNMGIENKSHSSCMQIMLSGSIAQASGGLQNLAAYGGHLSAEKEKIVKSAKDNCVALEELKLCLVNLYADTVVINNHKRQAKEAVENFPNVSATFKSSGVSK